VITRSDSTRISEQPIAVSPINRLHGELRLPGDKSISHRAAMIAALAHGKSRLENFSSAQDCAATLHCLKALGVGVINNDSHVVGNASTVTIQGKGASGFQEPSQILDAQNSGTTMRLLAGILAGQPFTTTITGDESLRNRPMLRVAEPLRLMGAEIDLNPNGCAPLRVRGRRPLRAISYQLPIASAQIKSAVLLAGLFAEGTTTVEETVQTRDHTERMMLEFGGSIERRGNTVSIRGGAELHARRLLIPGDISSAAYFIAAAVSLPGSDLLIRDIGLNPTRTAFVSTLQAMGADIVLTEKRLEGGEPIGSIRVRGMEFKAPRTLEVKGAAVSNLIDELPLLGFLAASLGYEMTLRDAGELRVKESDRIAATVANLARMGASIEEHADGWHIRSGGKLQGAALPSFKDHRIAMSCAVAALSADGLSQIQDSDNCIAVSLPEFWTLLEALAE
jgi:3-phosphoshikimate 1-carboxyvinyltransferase